MAPKEDLFFLIKGLSRTEKRYFTLDAQKSGAKSSNYLRLFKEINAMDNYDESKIKGKFPNLSMDKAYLYEAILKSMRDYRSPKSKRAQLKQYIIDSKFLYERALYEQCANRLKAAKHIAEELADSLSLLEISREERLLAKAKGIGKFNLQFDDFKTVGENQIRNLTAEFKYLDSYDFLISEVKTNMMYSKNEDRQRLQILFNPTNWEEPTNVQAKLRFLLSKALFYHLLGKSEIAGEYFLKCVQVWEDNPILRKEEFRRYIVDLSNALTASFINDDMETVERILENLKNEKPVNFHEKNLYFSHRTKHELNYIIHTENYGSADELINLVTNEIEKYPMPTSGKLTLIFQIAIILLSRRDYEGSKMWTEKIFQIKKEEDRLDLKKAARVLYSILAAELFDFDKVDNTLRNQHRALKNANPNEDVGFELNFISFLRSRIPFPFEKSEIKELKLFLNNEGKGLEKSYSYAVILYWMRANQI